MGQETTFDYPVVGEGTAGCVLASRLSQASWSAAMFEAGPESYSDQIMSPLAAPILLARAFKIITTPRSSPSRYYIIAVIVSPIDNLYTSLANRRVPNCGGRILSGSSGVNYGT